MIKGFICDYCGREGNGAVSINGFLFCPMCYAEYQSKIPKEQQDQQYKIICKECMQKDQRISELERDIKQDTAFWKQECDSLQKSNEENLKRIAELEERLNDEDLAELYEETKKFHTSLVKELKEINYNKTALAIEKLEELRDFMDEDWSDIYFHFRDIYSKINSMIKKLKGVKNET